MTEYSCYGDLLSHKVKKNPVTFLEQNSAIVTNQNFSCIPTSQQATKHTIMTEECLKKTTKDGGRQGIICLVPKRLQSKWQ